jgi:Fe-S-cluster-containing dehydrogenase component
MSERIFVVDLATCTGCYACSVACKDRAALPDDLDVLRVEGVEAGAYPAPSLVYRVVHCFHCASPPCIDACPSQAIAKAQDGVVAIERATCIGCGQCIEACPFQAIVMRPDGVAFKCDACADEVNQGWYPTCVRACPMRALRYGPASEGTLNGRVRDAAFDDHHIGPAVLYLCKPL